METYEADYRLAKVTAKDIVLPPFLSIEEENRGSFLTLSPDQSSEERKSSLKIEEETPLDGIPFVQEPNRTPPIGSRNSQV